MLFVPEDRARRLDEHEASMARIVGAGEDERWHLRKDGSRFWCTGVSLSFKAPDGTITGYVKIFRDATHLRTRIKYLENVLQECSDRQQELDKFLGSIAHEMRNPLSPLTSSLELLKRMPDASAQTHKIVEVMTRQLGHLGRLVEDLIDITRLNTGKLSITYETVQVQKLMAEALESCRPAAAIKGISLHPVSPPVPIEIEADSGRMLQVILNLLNNAIKYTRRGGDVWLSATVDHTHVLYYVKDNGQGIEPGLLPKIFDIFTQADGATQGRGAGLGIGLAVVKEIVALHQGPVEVRSEGPDKGSEFIVRIPLRKPDGPAAEPITGNV